MLAQYATGVVVVSVCADGVDHAMTANSFTSVSLEPPLVLVCVDRRAASTRRRCRPTAGGQRPGRGLARCRLLVRHPWPTAARAVRGLPDHPRRGFGRAAARRRPGLARMHHRGRVPRRRSRHHGGPRTQSAAAGGGTAVSGATDLLPPWIPESAGPVRLWDRVQPEEDVVTYVIAEPCVDVKDKSPSRSVRSTASTRASGCLLHPARRVRRLRRLRAGLPGGGHLYGDDVPEEWTGYTAANVEFFDELGCQVAPRSWNDRGRRRRGQGAAAGRQRRVSSTGAATRLPDFPLGFPVRGQPSRCSSWGHRRPQRPVPRSTPPGAGAGRPCAPPPTRPGIRRRTAPTICARPSASGCPDVVMRRSIRPRSCRSSAPNNWSRGCPRCWASPAWSVPVIGLPDHEVGALLAGATGAGRLHGRLGSIGAAVVVAQPARQPDRSGAGEAHLTKVAQWSRDRGTIIVSDECYAGLDYGDPAPSLLADRITGGDHTGLLIAHSRRSDPTWRATGSASWRVIRCWCSRCLGRQARRDDGTPTGAGGGRRGLSRRRSCAGAGSRYAARARCCCRRCSGPVSPSTTRKPGSTSGLARDSTRAPPWTGWRRRGSGGPG